VIRILQDEDLRRSLGENALKYANKFSWDKTAEQFMKIIEGTTID